MKPLNLIQKIGTARMPLKVEILKFSIINIMLKIIKNLKSIFQKKLLQTTEKEEAFTKKFRKNILYIYQEYGEIRSLIITKLDNYTNF